MSAERSSLRTIIKRRQRAEQRRRLNLHGALRRWYYTGGKGRQQREGWLRRMFGRVV